jgi:hypothetical protein
VNGSRCSSAHAPFQDPAVAAKFASYPPRARKALLALRELVFKTAGVTPGAGPIEETLKWGEPAYLTSNGAGSTLRMDWKAKSPCHYAMYFHRQTGLVETFRSMFTDDFAFEGQRALVSELGRRVPRDSLAICIAAALTYRLAKRNVKASRPRG